MQIFTDEQINSYLTGNRMNQFGLELSGLVQIQSESGNPDCSENLSRVVEALEGKARLIGFETEVLEAKFRGRRFPALLATHEVDPDAPWVLIYNHADVQPEMDIVKWNGVGPFSGLVRDGIVYGRGATDDKGPLLGTIYALDFLVQNNLLRCNIQLIAETAEEIGSVGFKEMTLEAIASGKIKKPSHVFVSDTEFKEGHPNLLTTLRGIICARVGLKLADAAVHSGIAGGVAFNPGRILSDVLGELGNPYTLRANIPGFYDGVEVRAEDQHSLETVAKYLSPEGFMDAMKLHAQSEHDAVAHLIKLGLMPTYEFNLYKGGGAGTAIPASAEAYVSMRLVEGQDPSKIEELFLKALSDTYRAKAPRTLYGGVSRVESLQGLPRRIEVAFEHSVPAFRTAYDTPFHRQALASYGRFFDKEPLLLFEGGTIGTLPILQDAFGKDIPFVLFGQSLDTDGYHAEGEHFQLAHAKKAISAVADYLANLS